VRGAADLGCRFERDSLDEPEEEPLEVADSGLRARQLQVLEDLVERERRTLSASS
jgi:hypothetical protein